MDNEKAASTAGTVESGTGKSFGAASIPTSKFTTFVENWQAKFQRPEDWTEAHSALLSHGFTDAELSALAKRGLPYGKLFVLIIDLLTRGIISPGEEREGVLEYLDHP